MKEENIKILENMKLSISTRQAIIDEMIDVLKERDFLYSQGVYTGYVNLLFIMDYISANDVNSLISEVD